jgi:TonB family protein
MSELITYTIKVSVCLILFYGLYVLTLKKETHFTFNRWYLLFSMIISLIIPILHFSYETVSMQTSFTQMLQTVQVASDKGFIARQGISPAYYVTIIYLAGLVILSVRFITRFISILFIRRHCIIERKDRLNIALCNKHVAPFSFFHTIFIDKKMLNDRQMDKIILHETIHIRQLHSLDIIFTETICILTWFNPVSWMIKSALKETHEYLADVGVSEQMPGSAEYFLLLIRNAVGVQPGLANNFNKSLTLKRLKMMKKPRSGRLSLLKALPVIPVVVLLLMTFSCSNKADELKSQNSATSQKDDKTMAPVDKMPEFPGGQEAMTKFLLDNIKYPEAAKKNGIEGKVYVSFTITKSGKTDHIKILKKGNELLDTEAIRVVSVMPVWIPGKNKGTPVDVEITLPIYFKLAVK